jgi:purine nucleosidase
MNRPPTPLILDIDNALTIPAQDTDDALALALALTSPEVDILGITTCSGNCRAHQSTVNTLRLLETAGTAGIPVATGRQHPLLRTRNRHFRYLEAKTRSRERTYWQAIPPPQPPRLKPSPLKAHELMIHLTSTRQDKPTIVAMGSLTNLALAILVDPDIVHRIAGLIHMGGSFEEDGFEWSTPDIPAFAWQSILRFNTAFDPEASKIVLRSGIPITLIPANVSVRVFLRLSDVDAIEGSDTPFHRFTARWVRPWVEWSIRERQLRGAHMHDPLTLCAIIRPEYFTFDAMDVDWDAFPSGGNWLVKGDRGGPLRVATGVDAAEAERFLIERLSGPVLIRYDGNAGSKDGGDASRQARS